MTAFGEWQPIETAPKDGRVIILAVDYKRSGYDRVHCGFWVTSRRDRWIIKDQDTQVRDGWIDESRWQHFVSADSASEEWDDQDEGVFVREFDPTHWMPLPEPPK